MGLGGKDGSAMIEGRSRLDGPNGRNLLLSLTCRKELQMLVYTEDRDKMQE